MDPRLPNLSKQQLPKRMFRKHAVERVSHYETKSTAAHSRMKRMPRDHADVLQNIEFMLVQAHRGDDQIDDGVLAEAVDASRKRVTPEDPNVLLVVSMVSTVRTMRADVGDETWEKCLKTVADSIRRHSDLRPGQKAYIRFIEKFII